MRKKIKPCSCDESMHLRKALRWIAYFAGECTGHSMVEDLAQINNLAHQGLELSPLVGDPEIGKVKVK